MEQPASERALCDADLKTRLKHIKEILTSPDILTFEFSSPHGKKFALVYLDGITDKQLLGELVIKPLGRVKGDAPPGAVRSLLASPEVKESKDISVAVESVLAGDAALFVEGQQTFYVLGLKLPPGRAVAGGVLLLRGGCPGGDGADQRAAPPGRDDHHRPYPRGKPRGFKAKRLLRPLPAGDGALEPEKGPPSDGGRRHPPGG